MRTRVLVLLAALGLAALASSCAVNSETAGGSAYAPPAQDPARIGLPPAYRAFYDELRDDGDWTLIEPYGWCFRPRVNFVAWRPYEDGWWEPSDTWGWIWDTYEPFGWVTYHYGAWFYDSYQGWVWTPGPVWGPAWVAWVEAGDYVGWAPLPPAQYTGYNDIPGGMFTFAPASQMMARDLGMQSVNLTRLPTGTAGVRPIVNTGHEGGVTFNRGPDRMLLQRMGTTVTDPGEETEKPRVRLGIMMPRSNESDLVSRTNLVVTEGLREFRQLREHGIEPPPLPPGGPRVLAAPPAPRPAPPAAHPAKPAPGQHPAKHAPADSLERHVRKAFDRVNAVADSAGRTRRRAEPAGRDSTRDR